MLEKIDQDISRDYKEIISTTNKDLKRC